MEETRRIEIWFFIGSLVLIYGLLILGAGVFRLAHPDTQKLALPHLHADIWWGALLCVIGMIYTVRFWPWRSKNHEHKSGNQ